ncbi:MAG: TIGR04255 family protein [Myxococcota bacterium]
MPPYSKPPIVEALVQLNFVGGREWEQIVGPLVAEFSKDHPRSAPLERYEAMSPRWIFSNDTGGRVAMSDAVLSVHVVGPYPGWGVFRPRIDDVFRRFASIAKPGAITQAGIRYIDRILIPAGEDVSRFFKALPAQLPSQPRGFDDFQMTTSTLEPETGVRSTLTLLSTRPQPGAPRDVLYDLNLTLAFAAESPPDDWSEAIERLHQRQKDIFEESITDDTRRLFE